MSFTQILMWIMAIGALVGGLDKVFGNRLGPVSYTHLVFHSCSFLLLYCKNGAKNMPCLLILSFCGCYVVIFPILRKNADINFFCKAFWQFKTESNHE